MPLSKDPEKISSMFDEISGNYDRLNHILSFGIDRSWRRRLVRELSCQIEASGRTVGNTKVLRVIYKHIFKLIIAIFFYFTSSRK